MARISGNTEADTVEHVAGNGLLHRRALLRRGAMFAGALGVGAGIKISGATAEPLVEAPWSLAPGDPVPAYQLPSKFAKNVVRTLSNPDFEARTSQSRTPHHLLDGNISERDFETYAFAYECRILALFEDELEQRLGPHNYWRRRLILQKVEDFREWGGRSLWRSHFTELKKRQRWKIRTPEQFWNTLAACMRFVVEQTRKNPDFEIPE